MPSKKVFHWRLTLLLLLFLTSCGITFEFGAWSSLEISQTTIEHCLVSSGLLAIYLVPLGFFIRYCIKKWQLSTKTFLLALFSGAFTAWIAAYLNNLGDVLLSLVPSLSSWTDAIVAPPVEESIKAATAFLIVYLLNTWQPKQLFLAGLGAGLGFQITEDISYITSQASNDSSFIYQEAFSRISGSLSSHWLYSACFTLSIYLAVKILKKEIGYRFQYLYWLCMPLVFHFLWDSPITIDDGYIDYFRALINAISLLICYDIYKELDQNVIPDC